MQSSNEYLCALLVHWTNNQHYFLSLDMNWLGHWTTAQHRLLLLGHWHLWGTAQRLSTVFLGIEHNAQENCSTYYWGFILIVQFLLWLIWFCFVLCHLKVLIFYSLCWISFCSLGGEFFVLIDNHEQYEASEEEVRQQTSSAKAALCWCGWWGGQGTVWEICEENGGSACLQLAQLPQFGCFQWNMFQVYGQADWLALGNGKVEP